MTNKQLVKEYEKLQNKASKLTDWFCENNMGDLRPSDMRSIENPSDKVVKYLETLDKLAELKNEAERRYGPRFMSVGSLKA